MFKEPVRLRAHWGTNSPISSPDLCLAGSGTTPRGSMDDLCAKIVEEIHRVSSPDVRSDDPLKAAISRFFDLSKPCPDPGAKRCGSRHGGA